MGRFVLRLAVTLFALATAATAVVHAQDTEVLAKLNDEQRAVYLEWRKVRAAHDRLHDQYWAAIEARRTERRRKRGTGEAFTPTDFVEPNPPKYVGPLLRPDIAKVIDALKPPQPETQLPVLADYLAQAKAHFGYVPRTIPEREFKRRYAVEALAVGLTKDQVVRVYALETGGRGTFDMQAGFDPETKKGRAISSALGYAQLLAANSINELVQFGEGFIARLNVMAVAPGTMRERQLELIAKANVVRSMLRVARSVPNEWGEQVKLSTTPRGMGIHTLNLDGDIGPWLQVIKLRGLKDTAAKAGRHNLSGAEIELMNLAGPRTGLDMMEPAAVRASTANFFSQAGYYRNTIVREKSAPELLAALDKRMGENMVRAGSIEFAAIFDEIMTSPNAPPPVQVYRPVAPAARPQPAIRPSLPAEAAAPATTPTKAEPRLQWAPRQLTERPAWVPLGIAD